MINPYWTSHDGRHVLYHGDCLDILPTLGKVDAVVTDPPYGLGERWTGGTWGAAPMYTDARKWDLLAPQELIDSLLAKAKEVIIWGGNNYQLPPSRCWLSFRKTQRMDTMADFELAWTNLDRPSKEITENRCPDGTRFHPTQKPISVMLWSLGFLSACETVLDPFTGSGTTGVACIRTGRKFIGIEISKDYCDIAVKRMEAELAQGQLFEVEKPKSEQLSL